MPTHQSVEIRNGEGPDGVTTLTLDAGGLKDANSRVNDFKEHIIFTQTLVSGDAGLRGSGIIWTAPGKYRVESIKEKHSVGAAAQGSGTMQFAIAVDGVNPSSGTLITAATTVSGAVNTTQALTLSNSLVLNENNSLCLICGAGTLAGYVGNVSITVSKVE